MTKQLIIERTIKAINNLPEKQGEEISDFAEFLFRKFEEQQLSKGIIEMVSSSKSFDFLNSEEDIYTVADLKEVYNG